MFINNISCYIMNDPEDLEFGDNLLQDLTPPGTPPHTPSYIDNTPPGTPKKPDIAKMTPVDEIEKKTLESFKSKGTQNNYAALRKPLGGKRKTRRAKKSKRKSKKSKRKSKKSKRKQRKTRRRK